MDEVSCYCSNLRRAALAATARYDDALAPHGMKVTQFSLLHAVERRGRANLTALAEGTGLDRSTLGRNLRVLEGMGLVALSPGDDQRDRVASLTPRGRTRLRAATRTWKELQVSLAATLGDDAPRLVEATRRVTRLLRPGPAALEVSA
ncbi:MAG: MarR family winged helix-turn-helix transcriptional regulator [Anaeromyxobacteraceae bacterium]